jgi:hypothetical protein
MRGNILKVVSVIACKVIALNRLAMAMFQRDVRDDMIQ